MSDVRSVLYEDFSLGLDTSRGLVSRDARQFRELNNYLVNESKQLERRPPCIKLTGQRAGNTQGFLYLNGLFITIAKFGGDAYASPNVESLDLLLEDGTNLLLEDGGDFLLEGDITSIPITTLYFDNPEYCTSWVLIDLLTFNERVCALIRHTFTGTAVTERVMLHVWDDTRPTWVDDPFVPTNWNKTFPLQAYGAGTLGAVANGYVPVMTVSSDKLFISRPDGNTSFSATNRPRAWNDRTAQEILADGRWWYWITPIGTNTSVVITPTYDDFTLAARYAGYVLEYGQADGTWAQFTEVPTAPSGALTYAITSTVNRFDVTKPNETTITYRGTVDTVVRFRALAQPAMTIQAGEYLTPSGALVGGTQTVEGAAEVVATVPGATILAPAATTTSYLVLTKSARTPGAVTLPYIFAGTAASMPLNGQQRYWSRIVAVATTNSAGPPPTAFNFDLTDTVTIAVNSRIVTGGAGALFLTEVTTGGTIEVNGERRIVSLITSNTLLEVSVAFSTTAGGVAATRDIAYRYANQIGEVGNVWYAEKEAEATLSLAGSGSAGFINTSLYDNSGGRPVCLAPGQNRLFVQYVASIQMWQTDAAAADMRMLSVIDFGAGDNTAPKAALVDGLTAMPTVLGPRLFSPEGLSKDYIRMLPIGDPLLKNTLPEFTTAAWWSRTRTLMMSGADDGRIFCFNYHPDAKVRAWSVWTVEGLTVIDRMFVAEDYLYVQSGLLVYRFDPSATVYRDTTDATGDPAYESQALWLYNDLGNPARNKHLVRFEIQQQGGCEVRIRTSPSASTEYVNGPPNAQGYTQGRTKAPLAAFTPTVGLEVLSTDETGHVVYAVGYDFRLSAR